MLCIQTALVWRLFVLRGLASILYVCCLDDLAALVRGISGLAVLAAFGLTALDACLLGALGLVPAALG